MKNENFFTVQGWMINELGLKGNELMLYAIIYGFSQDGQSEFYGSIRYIEKMLGLSNPTVQSLIKRLISKKLIYRTRKSHYKVYKKLIQGCIRNLYTSVQETYTNKYNTNNNNKNANTFFDKKDVGLSQQSKQPNKGDDLDKDNSLDSDISLGGEEKESPPAELTYEPVDEKILTAPQTKWKNIKRAKRGLPPTFKKKTDEEKQIEQFMEAYKSNLSIEPVRKSLPVELKQMKSLNRLLKAHKIDYQDYLNWWFGREPGTIGYGFQQFTSTEFVGQYKEQNKKNKNNFII